MLSLVIVRRITKTTQIQHIFEKVNVHFRTKQVQERTVTKMPPKRKSEGAEGDAPKKKNNWVRDHIADVTQLDFANPSKSKEDKPWNLKIATWNVNGIRAWSEKNCHSYIKHEDPDVFCVQETKCVKEKIPKEIEVEGYHCYWLSGDKEGYSGTGLYTKKEPLNITYGLGIEKHDKEGRVITVEFDDYYMVTAYVPNSGKGLVRIDYRTTEWDPDFRQYLKDLDQKKPVILCGDLNVAHQEIDLKNPKGNKNKTPGFTDKEREQFTLLLKDGNFIDTFRHLYPDKKEVYSFWTYMMNARAKNAGWRLDYFLISERLKSKLCDSLMRTEVMGSDHCPVVLLMAM